MSELKLQIADQLHQAQAKYTYFLLAAAASGIALAVQRTDGHPLNWSDVLLGVAVALWGVSFFAGCRNRGYFSSTLYANLALLQLQDGSHPETPTHPQAVAAACEGVRTAAENNSASGNTWGKWQFRFLIIGALFFLAWHIVGMANTTALENTGGSNNSIHTYLEVPSSGGGYWLQSEKAHCFCRQDFCHNVYPGYGNLTLFGSRSIEAFPTSKSTGPLIHGRFSCRSLLD